MRIFGCQAIEGFPYLNLKTEMMNFAYESIRRREEIELNLVVEIYLEQHS